MKLKNFIDNVLKAERAKAERAQKAVNETTKESMVDLGRASLRIEGGTVSQPCPPIRSRQNLLEAQKRLKLKVQELRQQSLNRQKMEALNRQKMARASQLFNQQLNSINISNSSASTGTTGVIWGGKVSYDSAKDDSAKDAKVWFLDEQGSIHEAKPESPPIPKDGIHAYADIDSAELFAVVSKYRAMADERGRVWSGQCRKN